MQFPDEQWLDLRRLDLVAPIMLERLDIMKAKGCDAVEWDNADLPVHDVSSRRWPSSDFRSLDPVLPTSSTTPLTFTPFTKRSGGGSWYRTGSHDEAERRPRVPNTFLWHGFGQTRTCHTKPDKPDNLVKPHHW